MTKLLVFLAGIFVAASAHAQDERDGFSLNLDLPLVDLPFTDISGLSSPSMRQSLAVTKDVYYLTNYALESALEPTNGNGWHRVWTRMAIAVADVVLYESAPFGGAWMHEEWHRAVMTRHRTSSFNGIYYFAGGSFTAVDHESDADLARIKDGHNPDFVRLSAAGMESEHVLANAIEKDAFFDGTRTWNNVQLMIAHVSPFSYLQECAGSSSDTDTKMMNEKEGTDVAHRDFTGLDCNGWAYDLFHEDDKYADRGTHPSGVGIDRYRTFSMLSDEGRRYLKRQVTLSALNFVDPFLLGRNGFASDDGRWNATLRHFLTSFGYAVDANAYVATTPFTGLVTLHNYWNRSHYFPGVEVQTFGWQWPVETDVRAMVWLQPKGQRFKTAAGTPGGLIDVTMGPRLEGRVRPYVELVGKTAGWVAGNVYLDKNLSVLLGVSQIAL